MSFFFSPTCPILYRFRGMKNTKFSFHRNLNATNGNKWSYKTNGGSTTQARTLVANDVTIKQPSGKAFKQCLQGGHRAVFAWFKTTSLEVNVPCDIPHHARRVRFNPKRGDKCFMMDGQRVDFLARAWMTESGECYATR